jgi:tetratricopeptide (TPR) repeat protein
MIRLAWLIRGVPAALLCLSLCGCLPSGQSPGDEEKESHFLAGKRCINTMDYRGAIEEFEKALELNPQSASAHFEVACLYVQKEPDPAAAIYHFERYLKLRPDAANAETVRQLVYTCKQDLAKTVLPLPITPGMQHQFEQLADENRRLREENDKWKAYFANRSPAPTNLSPTASNSVPVISAQSTNATTDLTRQPAGTLRKHVVQAGETPSAIARKYAVKLDAFMAVNPGLDPRRMRAGQTVNVPAP